MCTVRAKRGEFGSVVEKGNVGRCLLGNRNVGEVIGTSVDLRKVM